MLRGVRIEELDSRRVLSVLHAALMELSASQVPLDKVLTAIDEKLGEELIVRRATWGMGPRAEERQRAMMDMVGGPAPMREPT